MDVTGQIINFTKKEKILRKCWFISYLISFIFFNLGLLIIPIYFFSSLRTKPLLENLYFLFFAILGGLFYMFPYYLLYRCAYKKRGIKVLLLNIIFLSIMTIYSLINLIKIRETFLLIAILPLSWFLFVNFKLFLINRKYKMKLIEKTE